MAASNKNTEELLNYYVDRELSSAEEEELFAQLAENDELRAELKQMQTIHSETRNYLASMTPPAALTAGVFAKLGFTGTSAAAATQTVRDTVSVSAPVSTTSLSTLALMQNLWLPISAAIISATVTTVAIFTILTASNKPIHLITDPAKPSIGQTEQTQPPQPAMPVDTASGTGTETQARSGLTLPGRRHSEGSQAASNTEISGGKTTRETHAASPDLNREPVPATRNSETSQPGKSTDTRTGSEPAQAGRIDPAALVTTPTAPPENTSRRTEQRERTELPSTTVEKPAPAFPSVSNETFATNRTTEHPAGTPRENRPASSIALNTGKADFVVTTLPPYRTPVAILQGVPVTETIAGLPGEHLYLPFDEHSEPSHWALSLRYINPIFANNYSTRANQPSRQADFYNLAAALQYRLSDNHYLFIEAGQEAFAQNYNGNIWIDHPARKGTNEKLLVDANIYQNVMTPWATLNYMYLLDDLFGQEAVQPYFSFGAGWSLQYGWFLNRANAGVLMPLSNGFGIKLGAEHSMLLYNFDNTSFVTKKLGFTIGMNYQF